VCAERYRIEALIGEGTFGWVYAATSTQPAPQRVAIKVLRPEHAARDSIVARFKRRELELLVRVHAVGAVPNVVGVMDPSLLTHRGYMLLVLEYIDGTSLSDVIARERVLDQGEARRIAEGIARGLVVIHAAGGVHRDLKPDNIRLRATGEAVILDLGIAKAMWETQKLTGTGQHLMTPFYAAPEQLAGAEVDASCDMYAFGLILYEMLVGSVPLAGRSYAETLAARSSGEVPDPRSSGRPISVSLANLAMRCLAHQTAARPSAEEAVAALAAGPASLTLASATPRAPRWPWVALALAAIGAAGVAVGLAGEDAPTPIASAASSPSLAISPTAAPVAPQIDLGLSLDAPRRVFAGEHVSVTIVSNARAYVTLLALGKDGSGIILLPNQTRTLPVAAPDDALTFPSDREQRAGLAVVAVLEPGAPFARESLLAIAVDDMDAYRNLVPASAFERDGLKVDASAVAYMQKRAAEIGATTAEASYDIERRPR
jgi:serine/threonine-protein kinase